MESGLVSEKLSTNTDETQKGGGSDWAAPFSYSKIIDDNLPYYLSYGMTYEQYMFGDVELAVFYRKKHEIEEQQYNYHAWLQGMYVYEAIADVSPILHAFAAKGTTVMPYSSEPYAITAEQARLKSEREAKKKMEENKAKMEQFMLAFNSQRKKEEVN
ncbi:MAG: hypothetical protein IJK60_05535 [Clostridia bacterium]|nr:hypothetical protein [Clostridia bacterium]